MSKGNNKRKNKEEDEEERGILGEEVKQHLSEQAANRLFSMLDDFGRKGQTSGEAVSNFGGKIYKFAEEIEKFDKDCADRLKASYKDFLDEFVQIWTGDNLETLVERTK
jgi:DNA anti-recombination protein RmuC